MRAGLRARFRYLLEHNLAMTSLTSVLPAGTRRSTAPARRFARRPCRACSKWSAPRPADDDPAPRRPRVSRRTALVLAVVALVACAVRRRVLRLRRPRAVVSQVTEADVERPFVREADSSFMDGFASNDYVTPSAYELSDVRITQTRRTRTVRWCVDATATLANESF